MTPVQKAVPHVVLARKWGKGFTARPDMSKEWGRGPADCEYWGGMPGQDHWRKKVHKNIKKIHEKSKSKKASKESACPFQSGGAKIVHR